MTVHAGGPECPGGHTTGAWRLVVLLRALALPAGALRSTRCVTYEEKALSSWQTLCREAQ